MGEPAMINIGETVTFRTWKAFFNGAESRYRGYLMNVMRQHVELEGLILIEVLRASKQKWQVIEVCTEESNYNLEDEGIFLKADFYDTKMLLNAKPTKWRNFLLGELTENRVKAEQHI